MIRHVQLILGIAILAVGMVGVAFANTGPGGGCHTDYYYNVDPVTGAVTAVNVICRRIDCTVSCPVPAAGPGTGGYKTCYCPTMPGTCNLGYTGEEPGGQGSVACIWGCTGGQECYGPGPYPGSGGYAWKYTCWCE